MPFTTMSKDMMTLEYAGYHLTISSLELKRDAQAVIVKMNILNSGTVEKVLSSKYFVLAANDQEVCPHASYLSEPGRPGMLWTWKRLKPSEACTIIMRYPRVNSSEQFALKMIYRQFIHTIKHFYPM